MENCTKQETFFRGIFLFVRRLMSVYACTFVCLFIITSCIFHVLPWKVLGQFLIGSQIMCNYVFKLSSFSVYAFKILNWKQTFNFYQKCQTFTNNRNIRLTRKFPFRRLSILSATRRTEPFLRDNLLNTLSKVRHRILIYWKKCQIDGMWRLNKQKQVF